MKVISTELLLSAAYEAMFEQNENFETDIEHVIDFLKVMIDHSGFDVVKCKDCKWYDERISMCDNCGLPREQMFFCADGEKR